MIELSIGLVFVHTQQRAEHSSAAMETVSTLASMVVNSKYYRDQINIVIRITELSFYRKILINLSCFNSIKKDFFYWTG